MEGIIDLRINCDNTSPSGENLGIKYHLKTGDDRSVANCFQYTLLNNFIIDSGVIFTIDAGGQLSVHIGFIQNDGTIINNGQIFNV